MSKTRPCTCIIHDCGFQRKIRFADIEQIKWHLLKQHHPQELVEIACFLGIIQSKSGYHNYDWLAHQLAYLCIARN